MKHLSYILIALFSFLLLSCGTSREYVPSSAYTFQFEGNDYQIVGYTTPSGEGLNYLINRDEDDNIIFRALDSDRSGTLDSIEMGEITLDEANQIYRAGIFLAMEQDKHDGQSTDREFVTNIGELNFAIETYPRQNGEYQNRFLIYDLEWNLLEMYWDNNSNGIIDEIEQGERSIKDAQIYYEKVLALARDKDRLQRFDDLYIIHKKDYRTPAPLYN